MPTRARATRHGLVAHLLVAGVVFVSAATARPALAYEGRRLLVLEFRGAEIVGVPVMRELADGARSGALDAIGMKALVLQDAPASVREMGRSTTCAAEACELEIGRTLGADWVVTGEVTKVEERLLLRVKMFDTATAAMRATTLVEGSRPIALVRAVRGATARMVAGCLEASSASTGSGRVLSRGDAGTKGTPRESASGPVRLAVRDFRGPLDAPLLDLMAGEARAAAAGLDGRYSVVGPMPTAAVETSEGEARAGLVISGSVARTGGLYVVTLELRETDGALLVKTERLIAPSELALMRSVRAATARLLSQADDGVRGTHP